MSDYKKYSWLDKFILVVCLLILGTGLGYGWRMHHEFQDNRISPDGVICIRDLSMEIGKKKEFYLYVDKYTMLHFLPLKKAQYEMAVRREERP
jgi:hypothetical protein